MLPQQITCRNMMKTGKILEITKEGIRIGVFDKTVSSTRIVPWPLSGASYLQHFLRDSSFSTSGCTEYQKKMRFFFWTFNSLRRFVVSLLQGRKRHHDLRRMSQQSRPWKTRSCDRYHYYYFAQTQRRIKRI